MPTVTDPRTAREILDRFDKLHRAVIQANDIVDSIMEATGRRGGGLPFAVDAVNFLIEPVVAHARQKVWIEAFDDYYARRP